MNIYIDKTYIGVFKQNHLKLSAAQKSLGVFQSFSLPQSPPYWFKVLLNLEPLAIESLQISIKSLLAFFYR